MEQYIDFNIGRENIVREIKDNMDPIEDFFYGMKNVRDYIK